MKLQKTGLFAAVVAVGLLTSSCSGEAPQAPTAPENVHEQTDNKAEGSDTDSVVEDENQNGTETQGEAEAQETVDGAVDEIRDGVWQIGDAGEVEFAFTEGTLNLVDTRAFEGWQHRVSDEKPDEIEVHFTKDNQKWKFEVELEHGGVEIEKELKIYGASSGEYTVGSAGTVTLKVEGDLLTLTDVKANEKWQIAEREESSDEIEIKFKNDAVDGKAELEAEVQSDGVEVEITQKLKDYFN